MNRAERRRRERAEAKLYKQIDQSYDRAEKVGAELIPMIDRMIDVADRRGWDDVIPYLKSAVRAVVEGNGLELQQHMARATELINAHEPPEATP